MHRGNLFLKDCLRALGRPNSEIFTSPSKERHLKNDINEKPFDRRPSYRAVVLRLVWPTIDKSLDSENSMMAEWHII